MAYEKCLKFDVQPQADLDGVLRKTFPSLRLMGFSDDIIESLLFIIRELLTSVVAYACFTATQEKMTSFVRVCGNTVTVEVCAPVDMTEMHRLEDLDRAIQFIQGYQDPFEACLMTANSRDTTTGGSGPNSFHLAKIAYEGKANLDFYVSEDDVLHLFAIKNLGEESLV
jgi:hypothetical protein